MRKIDFRSDTVTQPTIEMKEAMMSAPLGDDVFADDPSVNDLERKVAAMFGMDAALFCPSGTMTNQIAIKVHTSPGDEVICDKLAHIYNYEGGGIAFNSSCSVKLLHGNRGRFTSADVLEAINPDDPHFPISRLVSIENTCNKGGGSIWDMNELVNVSQTCKTQGLQLHLDGARLFNALIVSGVSTTAIGANFNSISICMSKGLGCPVGSLLVGEKDFIHKSRRVRKVFGGGMRQSGMLAAACSYALDHHINRLAEDHQLAKDLAGMLQHQTWVKEVVEPDTNIVVVELQQATQQDYILTQLAENGILAVGFGKGKIRFVTHLDLNQNDLNLCRERFKNIN